MRDFDFWRRAAQRKDLNEKIRAIHLAQVPWIKAEDVKSEMALYQSALARLDAFEGGAAPATPKVTSWLDVTGGRRQGRG